MHSHFPFLGVFNRVIDKIIHHLPDFFFVSIILGGRLGGT